ncbi:MAG: 3-deoxy-D-manno-octulosonic acid transferase [Caulobacteraceae bacterium]
MNRRPPSLAFYALATRALSPLVPAVLRARAKAGKEDAARLGERRGHASLPRPEGRLAWLHGVSVGESLSLLPLVERLHGERPNAAILVTSGTRASAEVLARRLPAGAVHQYAPIDTPGAVGRFLDHWRPDLGVFVESELWPNLIVGAKLRGTRLALVSARLSPSSAHRWRRVPGAARAVLGAFDLLLARDQAAADAFAALGARVDGIADLKFAAAPLPADGAELGRLRAAIGARPVIVGASTHAGEESALLDRFVAVANGADPRPLLILVPRHPARGADIERLARDKGLGARRRAAGAGPDGLDAYVADTIGELGLWYRLANLAVLGGGFAPGVGGHNPLEPARLGCPFVVGSNVEDWPIFKALEDAGGTAIVAQPAGFDRYLRAAIKDPAALAALALRAADFTAAGEAEAMAASDRVLELIAP